jgi:glucose dehydrogenase
MLRALSTLLNSSILWIVLNAAQDILFVALLYLTLIYPRSDTGFYSWHPAKRIVFLIFLPLVLLFKFLTAGCHCGCCCHCQDDD